MVHHYRGIKPIVRVSGEDFSIVLTNSATSEQITVNGSLTAPREERGRAMSRVDLESLATHLADAMSRWEGQAESGTAMGAEG